MSITLTGTIERKAIGMGAWALVADDGKTYEIYQASPKEMLKNGLKVEVKGEVREDVMSFAMIGPILEVKSFQAIDS
ncbi:hypothetical protein IQ264_29920 [Phormidium sp. LEGE 05292]|uniref:hypothetical protein n=1 Tax=[Phormidium] sp. LEGE 05292 TaxID=767427 RepID=UPI0018823553|nr:hypothetical protein [Phormidium sp. LEGE 05292]MBE9229627.1 hypothetical protein [Phormidium sp. LEGE 05292]